ncbi:hypothetical protein CSOJ01_05925 [Colletotrichum sojae]|uniref:Uncharacterized protein n=1 Tax=Colletotrichum sojae TaxID=2175907 RepID=A0A8H6JDL4_9PEZI|nr:hypothetical protein CSOJ01_05925 [Colletotrichum sojae]
MALRSALANASRRKNERLHQDPDNLTLKTGITIGGLCLPPQKPSARSDRPGQPIKIHMTERGRTWTLRKTRGKGGVKDFDGQRRRSSSLVGIPGPVAGDAHYTTDDDLGQPSGARIPFSIRALLLPMRMTGLVMTESAA